MPAHRGMSAKQARGYKITRHRIKQDVLCFGIPALVVFIAALSVSAATGRYDGLVATLWRLILDPSGFAALSANNIVGLAMLVVGLSVAFTGVFTLKRFYSSSLVIRERHQLITHGPYRFVRHPVYFGALVACFGAPIYASSLLGFAIMTALIPLVLNRIRMEEELLLGEFGDAYRKYRETTKKLIPFVY